MKCSKVQNRLSAYHDGELSADLAAEVADHVIDCASCAAELASFGKLSNLSRRLSNPPIPTEIWDEVKANFRGTKRRDTIFGRFIPKSASGKLVAIAASILIAAGIGIIASQSRLGGHDHDHLAANFSKFLDEFNHRPHQAQQILLTNFEGRPTSMQEAAAALGYHPIATKRLPPGCTFDKIYLLKMPCCTCAEVVCNKEDGQSIAIFEHDSDQPVWFGKRPTVECRCHDTPTSVVQIGDRLAFTWKNGQRYVTVIGADTLEEITDFVAYLSTTGPG